MATIREQPRPQTLGPQATLSNALDMLFDENLSAILIADGERTLGKLGERDLLAALRSGTPLDQPIGTLLAANGQTATPAGGDLPELVAHNEYCQRALFENLPFLVWLKDANFRYQAVNRRFAEFAGVDNAEELLGKSDFDLWPQEIAEACQAGDRQTLARRRPGTRIERMIGHPDTPWLETHKAPIVDDAGNLLGTVGCAIDISDRKRAEEAMILRGAALAGLIRGEAPTGILELILLSVEAEMPAWRCSIMLVDASGKHLRTGAAPRLPEAYTQAIDGMAIGEGIGSCGTAAARRQAVIVSDVFEHPYWAPYHDLARLGGFAACWSEPIIDGKGELLGTLAAYHDTPALPNDSDMSRITQAGQLAGLVITHQRAAERLENSLDTFRGIFDSISEALLILDASGHILKANASSETLSGHPVSALTGHHYSEFCAPGLNEMPLLAEQLAEAQAGTAQTFEYWIARADGRIFPAEAHLHPGRYFDRPVTIASVVDISERKAAALRLRIDNELAHTVAAGVSRDDMLAAILLAMLRLPEFDSGLIHRPNADGQFELVAEQGLSEEFAASLHSFAADSPLGKIVAAGKLACSCAPRRTCCNEPELVIEPAFEREGLISLIVLPIVVGQSGVASLILASHRCTQVSRETLRTLDLLRDSIDETMARQARQQENSQRQKNLAGLFDALHDFILIVSPEGRIVHYNRAVGERLGYAPEQLKDQPIATLYPDKDREKTRAIVAALLSGRIGQGIFPLRRADGESVSVEARISNGYWNAQPVWFGIAQDIGARLIAEERQKLAASVFDHAHEGIMITDPRGRIVEVNSTFSELTGYSREEALGRNADLLKSGHHNAAFYQAMWDTIRNEGYWRGEVWNRRKSGELIVEALTISTVRNREGEISHFVGIFSDITLLKQHQQRLEHLAHFDALTQLPNRMLLGDRLQLAKAQAERNGKSLAVCYLDLDGFKPINDNFGHAVGDHLLIEVAQRLKGCLRGGDTVARLGGDEFVLLFGDLDGVHECDRAIGRVIASLAQPFRLSEQAVSLSASIGVTLYPEDGADSDTLLRHADQAMYAAKQAGRNRYHLFDPENDRRARVRREEISRIRKALTNNEFVLFYQPKVNMREGHVIGAEALIRWQHPELGLLQPADFLPAIEDSELMIDVGDWVIQETLRQMSDWNAQGIDLSVSINIAGNHLQHAGFAARLGALLAMYPKVSPSRIELEVLETAALEDMANVANLFEECRKLGVSFALDDFGTGYSSLTYFRRLPAEILKIDQSFVRDMLDDPDDLAIVEGVIGLTQAFQRKVIAEGVETVEHGLVLLLLGCDLAQGYGIARPMPAVQFPDWVRDFRPNELWSSATAFQWSREDLPMLIAEVDHSRWKKALHAYLDDPGGNAPRPASDNHRNCRFGRWYYGRGRARYAAVDTFRNMESDHIRIHQIGEELLRLHPDGDPGRIAALKNELDAASDKLTGYLQQIQAEALIADQLKAR